MNKYSRFSYEKGWNGNWFVVFDTECDADKYEEEYSLYPRACFGGYMNAYEMPVGFQPPKEER